MPDPDLRLLNKERRCALNAFTVSLRERTDLTKRERRALVLSRFETLLSETEQRENRPPPRPLFAQPWMADR